eukprot:scaffold66375_cov66-Phaeocystis_antarctica.AAC.3
MSFSSGPNCAAIAARVAFGSRGGSRAMKIDVAAVRAEPASPVTSHDVGGSGPRSPRYQTVRPMPSRAWCEYVLRKACIQSRPFLETASASIARTAVSRSGGPWGPLEGAAGTVGAAGSAAGTAGAAGAVGAVGAAADGAAVTRWGRWSSSSSHSGRPSSRAASGSAVASPSSASTRVAKASNSYNGSGDRRHGPPHWPKFQMAVRVVRTRWSTKQSLQPSSRTKLRCVP